MAPEGKKSPQQEEQQQEGEKQVELVQQQQQQQWIPAVLSPPSKVARFSSDESDAVTMASRSQLMLGLGLGLGGTGFKKADVASRSPAERPVFTFMQIQELEHQVLIFKYMAAGLSVPFHLVLPIWKSVAAASFGPHHFPSLMGYYGSLCMDYGNSMEPEPGRCRRTDGKKWRCSRDVVPDQKYCERHIHRGRNRLRKPVEAAGPSSPASGGAAALVTKTSSASTSTSTSTATIITNNRSNTSSNSNRHSNSSASPSPSRIGFSRTGVLILKGTACKSVPS